MVITLSQTVRYINFILRPNKLYLSSITKFKFGNKKNKSIIYGTGMQKTIVMICYRFLFRLEWNLSRQTLLLAMIKDWNTNTFFPVKHISIENFNNDAIDREFIKIGQMMKPWLINMLWADKIFFSLSIFLSIMNIHQDVLT